MYYEMKNKKEAWVKIQKWSSKDNKPIKSNCKLQFEPQESNFSLNLKKVEMDYIDDVVNNKV